MTGLLWGDAKAGKTTYAMSLPGKKLIINFDPDGFVAVAHRDDFDVLDLSQLDAQTAIEQARKAAVYIIENADAYNTVILDSLTTLAEASLHSAIARSIGASAHFKPSIDAPGLAGYGARNNAFNDVVSRILRATAQTKMHCFYLAHTDDPEYDKKGENIVQQTIMLSAKMRNTSALKVSEVWHMTCNDSNTRTVYLAPFGVKKPMGSRMFDMKTVPKFTLSYTPDKDDSEQPHALANIYNTWVAGGMVKLKAAPSEVAEPVTSL